MYKGGGTRPIPSKPKRNTKQEETVKVTEIRHPIPISSKVNRQRRRHNVEPSSLGYVIVMSFRVYV